MIWAPTERQMSSKPRLNLASRSRIRWRGTTPSSSIAATTLRACWVTHSPVGCAVTPGRPTDDPHWIQRVFTQPVIQAETVRQLGTKFASDALNGTVTDLALVVDRSKGAAYLDNILVRSRAATKRWTCAADNGNGVPGGPSDFTADETAMVAAPLVDEALWDEGDVLASITPEEQALIDDSNAATD